MYCYVLSNPLNYYEICNTKNYPFNSNYLNGMYSSAH